MDFTCHREILDNSPFDVTEQSRAHTIAFSNIGMDGATVAIERTREWFIYRHSRVAYFYFGVGTDLLGNGDIQFKLYKLVHVRIAVIDFFCKRFPIFCVMDDVWVCI